MPGNHDEFARQFCRPVVRRHARSSATRSTSPPTANGFSSCTATNRRRRAPLEVGSLISAIGPTTPRHSLNNPFQLDVRRLFGFSYWSFSAWAKLKVKNAVNFIGSFEAELAREARESEPVDADLREISANGALVCAPVVPPLGTEVVLDLVPPGGVAPMAITGRVIYHAGPGQSGLRFVFREGGGSRRLRELVRRFKIS